MNPEDFISRTSEPFAWDFRARAAAVERGFNGRSHQFAHQPAPRR
jgi:hypothetical protein